MNVTHEYLFERIRENPVEHLGGYSPKLLHSYFMGYEDARRFHGSPAVTGRLGMRQFGEWFRDNVYGGREGFAAFCQLLTDTEEKSLDLFFEFRRLRLKDTVSDTETIEVLNENSSSDRLSVTELILHEAIRTRTVMYFGNDLWLRGMWAMWSGYVWAEKDLGIEDSEDARIFRNFQTWLEARYSFAEGKNWGKLMEFLGMNVEENAREQFYDHFELFLEGSPPDAQTRRCKEWIAACLADVQERQAQGEL